jgi:threonine synthase
VRPSPFLVCDCGNTSESLDQQRCELCGDGLRFEYPDIVKRLTELAWPPTGRSTVGSRFASVLPVRPEHLVSLGEGRTPLLRSPALEKVLECDRAWLKCEGLNPTGSFKDRGTVVSIGWGIQRGWKAVGTVSTGNMAVSISAYAAAAGIPSTIVTAADVPTVKLQALRAYQPNLVRVDVDHGTLYFHALEVGATLSLPFVTGDSPIRIEGQKTLLYDIVAECGRDRQPTVVFVPLSSGGHALSLLKARDELLRAGHLREPIRLVGVQPLGCAPILHALADDESSISPESDPTTIAGSIRNPNPPSGNRILRAARRGEIEIAGAADDDMLAAQAELACSSGVWVQPDSASVVVAAKAMAAAGRMPSDARVVLILTGAGHRDIDHMPGDPSADKVVERTELASTLRDWLETMQGVPSTNTGR